MRKVQIVFLFFVLTSGIPIGFVKEVRAEKNEPLPSEMIAESIRYLHKSITALKTEKGTLSNTRRVAPIVTVVSGLLDTGIAPEEPLLRTGLDFLASFHREQKKQKGALSREDSVLLKQIALCLKKAKTTATPPTSPHRFDAGCPPTPDLVISPGVNTSLRIRHLNQPSLKKTIPTAEIPTDSFACHLLIATVHGLKSFPTPLPQQPLPPQPPLESLAWFVPPSNSKDRRETGPVSDNSSSVPASETSLYLSVSYQMESESRLLADHFRILRSTRRLE